MKKKTLINEVKRMQELAGINENPSSTCLIVHDTNGKIYGAFMNEELAEQWKMDAERNLGFEGSTARVNISKVKLYK